VVTYELTKKDIGKLVSEDDEASSTGREGARSDDQLPLKEVSRTTSQVDLNNNNNNLLHTKV
jgi:hypothetical protein